MRIIINWVLSALIIVVAAYLLPGVHIANFVTALVVAIILGLLNAFLKPVLLFLTLPINVLTLGLFTLVINAFIIVIITKIIPGFQIDNFWWAVLYSLLMSVINVLLHMFF